MLVDGIDPFYIAQNTVLLGSEIEEIQTELRKLQTNK